MYASRLATLTVRGGTGRQHAMRPEALMNAEAAKLAGVPQQRFLEYLQAINSEHLAEHPGESDLAARISSYELAGRMQSAAKEALDISQSAFSQRNYPRRVGFSHDL